MAWSNRRFSEEFLRPINHRAGIMKGYLKTFAYGLCHCEARGNLLEK